MRKIPDKGLGYGVLKYINKNENFSESVTPEILFNYSRQLDNVTGEKKIYFRELLKQPEQTLVQNKKINEKLIIKSRSLKMIA
ncbi:MAG: hypothetical protein R3A12_14395 [Ignavibacteria bacterium]